MTTFRAQNPQTGEFEPAQYGVGYGGQGCWFNRHFVTLEEAETFFTSKVDGTIAAYDAPYQIDSSCPPVLLARWSIVNVKKNGKPGKLRQTVQMYRIEA